MNSIIWIVAGGLIGWAAFQYFDKNEARGMIPAIIIGCVGAFFGGKVLGPVIGAEISPAGDFSMFALLLASAAAVGAVMLADVVSERYNV
jgi:uncharacterized membrane protein YeaQ/YmgE (transglycosylase-associated protein family)